MNPLDRWKPKEQGQIGACAAFAVRNAWLVATGVELSVSWLEGFRKPEDNQDRPLHVEGMLRYFRDYGAVRHEQFPEYYPTYQSVAEIVEAVNTRRRAMVVDQKLPDYKDLFVSKAPFYRVEEIQRAMDKYGPVVAAIPIAGWTFSPKGRMLPFEQPGGGFHQVCLVGRETVECEDCWVALDSRYNTIEEFGGVFYIPVEGNWLSHVYALQYPAVGKSAERIVASQWFCGDERRVTSPFGMRIHPIDGVEKFHGGIDISGNIGDPILTPTGGVVTHAKYYDGWGNLVAVLDKKDHRHLFAHMNVIKAAVGQKVGRGDLVGEKGMTGKATGPHLHYQVNTLKGGINSSGYACNPDDYVYWEDEKVDKLIVIHSEGDRGMGSLLEYKLKAPVVVRAYAQDLLDKAKTIILVGGPKIDCKAEVVHLAGPDRIGTAWAVLEYIERL